MVVQDALEAGRLVWLLPDWPSAPATVQAVFPSWRGLIPAVRALLNFLVEEFAAILCARLSPVEGLSASCHHEQLAARWSHRRHCC